MYFYSKEGVGKYAELFDRYSYLGSVPYEIILRIAFTDVILSEVNEGRVTL